MKYLKPAFLYLNVFLLILVGCEKEVVWPDDFYWYDYFGTATANRNGEKWEALPIARLGDGLSINCDYYHEKGGKIEHLSFWIPSLKEGQYKLKKRVYHGYNDFPNASFGTSIELGHVGGGTFHLPEGDSTGVLNIIEIKEDNIFGTLLMATFNVTFIKDSIDSNQLNLPDTLKFTDGVIYTKVIDL